MLAELEVNLKHRVVKNGTETRLRITLTNLTQRNWNCKLSQLYYRLYETTDPLPIVFHLGPGKKFEQDFRFLDEAWSSNLEGVTSEVTFEYSGECDGGVFSSSTVNPPSPSFTYSDSGSEADQLLVEIPRGVLSQPINVRILSVKVNGKERLANPVTFTLLSGGRQRIPGVRRSENPTIRYAARFSHNKRWSIQTIALD